MGVINLGVETQQKDILRAGFSRLSALTGGLRKSRNLFNKNTVALDKTLTASGGLTSLSDYCVSDFIPVNRNIGDKIAIRKNLYRLCAYDSAFNFIEYKSGPNSPYALPENAAFIKISFRSSDLSLQQVEYGTAFTIYEEYSENVEIPIKHQTTQRVIQIGGNGYSSGNIYNAETDIQDYSLRSDGSLAPLTGYRTTDFIPVDSRINKKIFFKSRRSINVTLGPYRSLFYDENKEPIYGTYNTFSDGVAVIPDDACFVRMAFNASTDRAFNGILVYGDIEPLWWDIKYKPYAYYEGVKKTNKNLVEGVELLTGFSLNDSGIQLTALPDSAITHLVPVVPNKLYFKQRESIADYNSAIYEFDKNRNFLRRTLSYNGGIYIPSSDCYYISFVYSNPNFSRKDQEFFLVLAEEENGVIGAEVNEDNKIKAYNTSLPARQGNYFRGIRITGLYENHIVIQIGSSGSLFYSENGWTGDFVEVTLDSTNFPSILPATLINYVMFFNTNAGVRCLIFANKNQIWCSTTGVFSGFEIPDVWDMKGNHHWRISDNDTDPTGERFRKYYPVTGAQTRQGKFTWHNGPVWMDSLGGQYGRGICFANYSNCYSKTDAEPGCLFYTEDGKNIYVQYEFGVYQKYYKIAGDASVKNSVSYNLGDDVDVTGFSGTFTSLSIKKRYNILPSGETPDPIALFEYENAITISAVSGMSFTLSDASSLNVGDTIILEGTATGDYAKLLTTNIDSTTFVGNGPVFIVKSKSGNTITLADCIGNPKNNLMCRHIHGVNVFSQGLCIFTGEEYPESWLIYVCPFLGDVNDGSNMNAHRWFSSVVRLNSSVNAFQRALGIYLRPDGKCVGIADSNNPYISRLTVRGKDIKMGGYGVMVFDLENIDNSENMISKIPSVNAGYCLYKIGDILLYSDYRGQTFYSEDEGDSWKYICTDNISKSLLIGWDEKKTRFIFDNTIGKQFIIKIK